MLPGDGKSFVVETGGEPVKPVGPVHVVLDVFFAGPYDFDRTIDMQRDLHGASRTVTFQATAKSTAKQMIVDHDFVHRQTCYPRCLGLHARDGLGADPDFAFVPADMNSTVH